MVFVLICVLYCCQIYVLWVQFGLLISVFSVVIGLILGRVGMVVVVGVLIYGWLYFGVLEDSFDSGRFVLILLLCMIRKWFLVMVFLMMVKFRFYFLKIVWVLVFFLGFRIINMCFCDFDSIILYVVIVVLCCGMLFSISLMFRLFLLFIFMVEQVRFVVFMFWIEIMLLVFISLRQVFSRYFLVKGFLICMEGCFFLIVLLNFVEVMVVLLMLLWLVLVLRQIMGMFMFDVVEQKILLVLVRFVVKVFIRQLLLQLV